MFRQYTRPIREDYDTEEEYIEADDAYEQECLWREQEYIEERIYGRN